MNIEDLIKEYGLWYLISDDEDIEYLRLLSDKISAGDFSFFEQIEAEVGELIIRSDNKEIYGLFEQYNRYLQILSEKVNGYCESLLGGGVLWSVDDRKDNKRLVADFYLHINETGEIYEKLADIELNISELQLKIEEIFGGILAELHKRLALLTMLFEIFKLNKEKIEENKAKLVCINENFSLQAARINDFLAIASVNKREIGEYVLKADNASRGNKDNQMNKDEIIQSGLKLIKSLVQCKT